jgi:hypothetical protein
VSKQLRIGGLLAVVLGLGLFAGVAAGDGCEDKTNSGVTTHVITLTNTLTMTQATADSTQVAKAEAAAKADAAAGHAAQQAGGNSNGVRIPAAFGITGSKLDPAPITVPPGVPIVLVLHSTDGVVHTVAFQTSPKLTIHVPAKGSIVKTLKGQPQGAYKAVVDDGPAQVALVALNDAGP